MKSDVQKSLDDMTNRVARTVQALREWRALEFTGHFVDVDEDMKTRIHEVLERTQKILSEWGYTDVP